MISELAMTMAKFKQFDQSFSRNQNQDKIILEPEYDKSAGPEEYKEPCAADSLNEVSFMWDDQISFLIGNSF